MIAVIYSGSRIASWKLFQEVSKLALETETPSINPALVDSKSAFQIFSKNINLIHHAESVKKIYVFAAGAATKETQQQLIDCLSSFFINAKVKVNDDVYGAALAACHDKNGVVGILGSGANCAYYDGKKLESNAYGLGYILGDEGSANYLGRVLLKNLLEGTLPTDLSTKLQEQYQIDRPLILERVYRKPQAQVYLASFLEFYIANRNHPYIKALIVAGFEKYFKTYLLPTIVKHPNTEVHFVGSVAAEFQDLLRTVASNNNVNITSVIKEPVHNILNYYTN